jgi:hypothetical protein
MTILNRLKYAWFLSVAIVGVGVVIAMIFSLDIGETLFSGKVVLPLLVVTFFISPFLEKYMKFK